MAIITKEKHIEELVCFAIYYIGLKTVSKKTNKWQWRPVGKAIWHIIRAEPSSTYMFCRDHKDGGAGSNHIIQLEQHTDSL